MTRQVATNPRWYEVVGLGPDCAVQQLVPEKQVKLRVGPLEFLLSPQVLRDAGLKPGKALLQGSGPDATRAFAQLVASRLPATGYLDQQTHKEAKP